MPIFRKSGVAVLFIHVPKTGGSSLEDLFAASGWEVHQLDRNGRRTLNPHRRCSPQHMHASMLEDTLRLDTFRMSFMVVREPIARFRSELLMQHPALKEPWPARLERTATSLLRGYTADPFIADNHLRPQSHFYVPGTTVFRFEDGLDHVAQTLRDTHSLDLDLTKGVPHRLPGGKGFSSSAIEIPEHLQRDLVHFYRDDYTSFDYEVPAPGR